MSETERGLRLVGEALAALVREEFPDHYSLADIAFTWPPPGIGDVHVEALRAYETGEPLASPNPDPVSLLPDRLTPEEAEEALTYIGLGWSEFHVSRDPPNPVLDSVCDKLRRLADREPDG